ncbi:acyltransferase family protein [Cryobacterium arcticum]|uniref:Acyltransferase n=1 Tax=Cryobacterium arcticum TaxID=670052 RepID=A0A317ZU98_9MICO|nr:acyltransferase family protein [Cryobacterium arcticum]PXA70026.1 acyltransferase [Cryobacterium arcticum]
MSTLVKTELQSAAPVDAPKKSIRRDIQGLRAVAVLAVVADHLFHWPTGGFVGVDVFFVLSGFLITGLLLREHDRTGTISFVGFYKRRVRRILPAATLVLAATLSIAFVVFNVGRANQTAGDAFWSFIFLGNWHFAADGTNYFLAGGPVSPLQHFWSLSVEEQFYFVWPWLMLLILALGGKATKWNTVVAHRVIGAVMFAIIIITFAWSIWETTTNPTWAYFSTFSRTWELGVGALLAVVAGRLRSIPSWLRPVLGWAGLLGIFGSIFFITDAMPFPGPWAAVPVLATALVILAGTGGEVRYLWPLTNRVSTYIGDISYSLYLWHFPVIILLGSIVAEGTVEHAVSALVLMAVLSVLSYHFVEQSVLKSTWLRDVSAVERAALRRAKRQKKRAAQKSNAPVLVGVALVAVGSLTLAWAALTPRDLPVSTFVSAAQAQIQPDDGAADASQVPASPASDLTAGLTAALTSETWPAFDPPADGSVNLRVPQWVEDDCLTISEEKLDSCAYGATEPSKTAVIVGDSIATSWLPGIIAALEPLGYAVQPLTREKCPVGFMPVTSSEETGGPLYDACNQQHEWVTEKVQEIQPDLIIMSDSFYGLNRLISQNRDDAANAEWKAGFGEALAALPAETKKVVLMSPPGAGNMTQCYTPLSSPKDCTGNLQPNWKIVLDAESAASEEAGVAFVDTREWFCVTDRCPVFVGTTSIYADTAHLTNNYSQSLAPVILAKLQELGLV